MKKFFITLSAFFVLVFFTFPLFTFAAKAPAINPIRILIVPGHDSEVWGAEYGNMKEADMTLNLGTKLYNLLKKDKRFQVYITRDSAGYTKEFSDYFAANQDSIIAFKDDAKKKFDEKVASGTFVKKTVVYHNKASQEVAIDLYGFNKWADENNIDAVIHIHFNDYPRANNWVIGKYKGFAIYMPEQQMANSVESTKLAKNIFNQLIKKYKTSNYVAEKGGLIPEQNLIALGARDTLLPSVRSVLIEYSYIYEKNLRKSATRLQAYKDMANLTFGGLKNYFFNTTP